MNSINPIDSINVPSGPDALSQFASLPPGPLPKVKLSGRQENLMANQEECSMSRRLKENSVLKLKQALKKA